MDFSLFNSGFYFYHDIWWNWVHFMGSFCVFCNFSHQLSFGGSRGLKPTVLGKTYKGRHLFHQCVIILCLFMFFVVPASPHHLQREGGIFKQRQDPDHDPGKKLTPLLNTD